MIRCVMLDCGGVVTYPKNGYWPRPVDIDDILEGKPLEFDMETALCAMSKHDHLLDEGQLISGLRHEYALRLEFMTRMNEDLGTCLSAKQLHKIAYSLTYNDERYAIYRDSLAGLKALSDKYRVGFVSNAMPSMVRALTNLGLTHDLDFFTVSCLVGCQKPEKHIYELALEECGFKPGECVFVDDLKENLLGAAHLGITPIRMKREFYYEVPSPDFDWHGATARDMAELKAVIDDMNRDMDA